MPNRILKDSIFRSEKINTLTDFQFRLWAHLLDYVDDYGRGDARPAIIKGICFPLRDRVSNKDIEKGLADLAGAGCVGLYKVDGKPYLYFPNWEKHQRVRTKVSKCPAPEESELLPQSAADGGEVPQDAARIQNPNPESESRIRNPNPESNARGCASADVKADKPPARSRFVPPTVDEVRAYCLEQGYTAVSPERFVSYYQANGWKVGKNPMKDWKAAVRGWESRDKEASATKTAERTLDSEEKAAIRRMMEE